MATNCAQITQKPQRQPHVELSEFLFHIYGYILAFLEPRIFTYKIQESDRYTRVR